MKWIKNTNDAIQYMEEHIFEDIDFDEIYKIGASSPYHFQVTFTHLTGMSPIEYIRKRRLTLAVKELSQKKLKVIDVAYMCGYETPESFTKAFKKFHGISPSYAKKSGYTFQALLPLSIQVTLKGEEPMDYRIETKKAMSFKGLSRKITTVDNQNYVEIPKFWDTFSELEEAQPLLQHGGPLGLVGICYNGEKEMDFFDYMIGVEANDKIKGESIQTLDIPEAQWAVFPSRGALPEAIQGVWKRIFSEFFPGTAYEHATLPELEIYPMGDTSSKEYYCEVWIPIKEK